MKQRSLSPVDVPRLVRFSSFFVAAARFAIVGKVRIVASENVSTINTLCALGGNFVVVGCRPKLIVEVRRTVALLIILQPKNVMRHILKARSITL